jgi:glycosyltransferase involved in cell wall biosynthesis
MPPKLIYLVTEDWYFVSHRLPMARAAKRAGFEVHVVTRVADHAKVIEREGFVLHPLEWKRGSTGPLHFAVTVARVRRLYRKLRPGIVHHVALAPTIVGSLAATGLQIPIVNAVAGLGFAFASRNLKARVIRIAFKTLLRQLLRRCRSTVLVQNPDDHTVMQSLGISANNIALIPGSGVDTEALKRLPEPPPPVTVAFVGRLLHDKGLPTLIAAHELLQGRGVSIPLLIAGKADPANPASISEARLREWKTRKDVTFLGHVDNIRELWSRAHIAILPSRREGLPLSLLEAAACGRALIATNVPGCREVARQAVNALLVPPEDPIALADAIQVLAANSELRRRLGQAGRQIVEAEFSSERIGSEIVALYLKLLQDRGDR